MARVVLDTLVTVFGTEYDAEGAKRAESGLARVRKGIDSAASSLTRIGTVATGALGGAGIAIVGFEREMNNLNAILQPTTAEMAALRGQARALGRDTAFSARQAAGAQAILAQRGFDANQILSATPRILDLAAAGNVTLAEAASFAGSAMLQFDLRAEDTVRITDTLARSATSTAASVQFLGRALATGAGASARQVGVDIEQVTAALGLLADRGVRAERAGTAVRNIITRIIAPSNAATSALGAIGISVEDLQATLRGGDLIGTLRLLRDAELDVAAAAKLFEIETGPIALDLINAADSADELTMRLRGAQGAAAQMAQTQLAGLPGAIQILRSTVEGLLIAIGDSGLTSALEGATRQVTIWLNALGGAAEGTRRAISVSLLLGASLLGVGTALRVVSFALGGLNFVLNLNAVALFRSTLATHGLTAAVRASTLAVLASAKAFLLHPVTLIIGAFVVLELVVRKITGGFSIFTAILKVTFALLSGVFKVIGAIARFTGISQLFAPLASLGSGGVDGLVGVDAVSRVGTPLAAGAPTASGGRTVNIVNNTTYDTRFDTLDASGLDEERAGRLVARTLDDEGRIRSAAVDSTEAY